MKHSNPDSNCLFISYEITISFDRIAKCILKLLTFPVSQELRMERGYFAVSRRTSLPNWHASAQQPAFPTVGLAAQVGLTPLLCLADSNPLVKRGRNWLTVALDAYRVAARKARREISRHCSKSRRNRRWSWRGTGRLRQTARQSVGRCP